MVIKSDDRYETTWHLYLSELERNPKLRLASFLRSRHVYPSGFSVWMSRHGHSVSEAKGRILQLRMDSLPSPESSPSFLPVEVNGNNAASSSGLLSGISLTLPDGTVVTIRRGSAEAVVSFLRLYSGEASPCSD